MSNMQEVRFLEPPQLKKSAVELDADQAVLSLLFDEISHGVLVVSPEGRVIHSNRAAKEDMASNGVLYTQRGELMALSSLDARLLHAALAKASAGVRSLVKLSGSGVTMMLSAIPLHARLGEVCQKIALFFERSAICDSGMFVFFARSHKLTRTEEQVLTYLCRGISTPDIAIDLNVAVSTVRSHVRSLCFKTGSKGSRELVNRVAMLPPVGVMPRLQLH
jgi:DNA-binding CsgD family transcriptional regulator